MKRTVIVAALSLASVSAFAGNAGFPQPSFNDNAAVAAQPTNDTNATTVARRVQPQPSFNDNAPIATETTRTTVSTDSASVAAPAHSFAG